ncbi:hypothetical protein [Caulobacter henricii]|uniref:Uncharacterized protein n=1 Tax=Caulobacter henricii TaxID=69395 RepID=A0A0N7JHR6_9CAUL|nr:hypothetical protein [Caulobacter henricii]ALL14138.1 hypothetical protein AQ619_12755 [Caulobacter henricii]
MKPAKISVWVEEAKGSKVAILNPLVQEITEALLALGGAAHRDMVVALVAKRRGIYRPPASLGQELDLAFSTYCGAMGVPGSHGLLHLPFGPSSRRWALTDQAHALLRSGAEGP